MHDKYVTIIEIGEKIFGPASERDHAASFKAVGKTVGQRKAQVRAALLDLREARAAHRELKPAAHGFDFGEFGHRLQSRERSSRGRFCRLFWQALCGLRLGLRSHARSCIWGHPRAAAGGWVAGAL